MPKEEHHFKEIDNGRGMKEEERKRRRRKTGTKGEGKNPLCLSVLPPTQD